SPDRLVFVVEHRPAAADPPVPDLGAVLDDRTRGGLTLALDLPAEAIGVAEPPLDPRSLPGREIANVRLAGQGGDSCGPFAPAPLVRVRVVEHPGGGLAEQRVPAAERVGEVRLDRCGRQVRLEAVEAV